MKTRKQKIIENVNILSEQRYLRTKFIFEDDNSDLPQFQVTPVGMNEYKIKFIWKSKGFDLPTEIEKYDLFNTSSEFSTLKQIYNSQKDAQTAIDKIIKEKQSLFK